jgi:bile acid:Na+ symporter, BASS family
VLEFPLYIRILSFVFVVVYFFSVTLETTGGQIIGTLRDFRLMAYALLANLVLVPTLGVVIALWLDLSPDIRTGLLMLAISPGGLLALQFARVSRGNRVFAVALLLVFSILVVFTTPALVALFFPAVGVARMPFTLLVLLLLLLVVVPLLAGRALQRGIPEQAPKFGLWLGRLSIVIFLIATLAGGKYKTPAIKSMGADGIAAIIFLVVVSWVIGWLMGGPEIRNRKALAIATSMRNVGVCFPIAVNYFPGTDVIAPILAFSGISIPMNMVFAIVTARYARDTEQARSRSSREPIF